MTFYWSHLVRRLVVRISERDCSCSPGKMEMMDTFEGPKLFRAVTTELTRFPPSPSSPKDVFPLFCPAAPSPLTLFLDR